MFKGSLLIFHTTIKINQRLKVRLIKQKGNYLANKTKRIRKGIIYLCHFVFNKAEKS